MDFDKAVEFIFRKEGGYVNDPTDRGGETNFGISARANPGVDIKGLTRDKAKAIYKQNYWDAVGAENLPEEMRLPALDAAVQHGVGTAKRMLAEAGGSVEAFIGKRKALYDKIVERDPSQQKFAKGWANRLASLVSVAPETPAVAATPAVEAQVVESTAPGDSVIEPIAANPRQRKPRAAGEDLGPTLADYRKRVGEEGAQLGANLASRDAQRAVVPTVAEQVAAHDKTVVQPMERQQAVGFGDAVEAALGDPAVMGWRILDSLGRVFDPADEWEAGDGYLNHADKVEADMTTEEVEFMRENGISGPEAMLRAQAQVMMQRDRDKVYSDAGAMTAFVAQLTGGMANPAALVAGLGIGAVARLAKVGSGAFIAAGRPGAAVAAHFGEQVVAEVATAGLQDMTGDVMGVSDYVMAAAGSGLLGGLGARGTFRAAAEKALFDQAHTIGNRADLDSVKVPDTDASKQRVDEQVADIQNIVNDTGALNKTKVMDEADIERIRREAEGKAEEDPTAPPDPEAEKVEPPKVEEVKIEVPEVIEVPDIDINAYLNDVSDVPEVDPPPADLPEVTELPTVSLTDNLTTVADAFEAEGNWHGAITTLQEIARITTDETALKDIEARIKAAESKLEAERAGREPRLLEEGDQITAEMLLENNLEKTLQKSKARYLKSTLGETLRAAKASGNPEFKRHLKMIDFLLARAGGTLDIPLVFTRARTGWSSPEGSVLMPAGVPKRTADGKVVSAALDQGATVEGQVGKADGWMADTLVHEAVHAVTQQVLYLSENPLTRAKLSRETLAAVEKLEGVLKRLQSEITPEMRALYGDRGPVYAAKNTHELIAQALSDADTQSFLSGMPASTAGGGRFSNALQEILQYVKEMVFGAGGDRSALDEVYEAFDTLIAVRGTARFRDATGQSVVGWPGANPPLAAPTQQPRWNERSFVQDRIIATRSKEWKRDVKLFTSGAVRSYDEVVELPPGTVTAIPAVATNPRYGLAVQAITDLAAQFLGPKARVVIGDGAPVGAQGVCLTAGSNHVIGLTAKQEPVGIMRTAVHEMGHAVYHQWASKVSPKLLDDMRIAYEGFLRSVDEKSPDQVQQRFSATSVHAVKNRVGSTDYALSFDEFTAEQFVKYVEQDSINRGGKTLGEKTRAALVALVDKVRALFDAAQAKGYAHPDQSFRAFFDDIVKRNGRPQVMEPLAAPVSPIHLTAGRQKFAERMFERAEDFLRRNPIDRNKLRVITAKIGGMSDGLRLAASGNPILNMIASLVTETTTGAAGRLTTVAIRKELTARQIMGNAVLDFEFAYDAWKRANKVGIRDDLITGDARRRFDKAVYMEILTRRSRQVSTSSKEVIHAANAVEAMFERARVAQVNAQTLGSGNLPLTAEGYIPQALDGRVLADADPVHVRELTDHLAKHFGTTYNWSTEFSEAFANFYVQRSRARAMGAKGQDIMAQSLEDTDLIRQTLQDMSQTLHDPALKQQAITSHRGLGHTKTRLDVGLMERLPSGKLVMDFYDTGVLNLTRRYVNRTSGSVALMEFGIAGDVGIRQLREAVTNFSRTQKEIPTKEELEAFDRVMAEISGLPIPGEVRSQWAGNLRLFTGIQRLGSMAVAQFAEMSNMIYHLGLSNTLAGIAALPKMMGEVGRLKRGKASNNHILKSIDFMGGEIGMETYKMTIPLDPPDGRVGTYMDDMGLASRLLAGASHIHSKVSFFRGMLAAQHRATAEQIVLKAIRFAQDVKFDGSGKIVINGATSALKDMGFSDELLAHLNQNLHRIAKFDTNGHLIDLDITKLPHPDAAQAFVQAVHRGTSQIIQGTFIGERGAWAHNDYMKLMLQFRTFGLTAVEKQWGRQRANRGYAYAAGILLGQMAFALPVHLARVQFNSIGREDEKEYVKNNLHPVAVVRALMNYGSMSGFAGDVLDVTAGIAGGWGGKDQKELLGATRDQSLKVGSVVPALGSLDAAARVASGNASAYTALKQLPGSNLPFIIPIINLTK